MQQSIQYKQKRNEQLKKLINYLWKAKEKAISHKEEKEFEESLQDIEFKNLF